MRELSGWDTHCTLQHEFLFCRYHPTPSHLSARSMAAYRFIMIRMSMYRTLCPIIHGTLCSVLAPSLGYRSVGSMRRPRRVQVSTPSHVHLMVSEWKDQSSMPLSLDLEPEVASTRDSNNADEASILSSYRSGDGEPYCNIVRYSLSEECGQGLPRQIGNE